MLGLWTTTFCQKREIERERDCWGLWPTAIHFKGGTLGPRSAAVYIKKDTAGTLVCVKRDCWDSELQLIMSRERLWGTLNYGRVCPERNKLLGTLNCNHLCQERDFGPLNYSFSCQDNTVGTFIYVKRVTFGTMNYNPSLPDWHFGTVHYSRLCHETLLGLWFMSRETLLGLWFMSRETVLGLWTTAVCVKRDTFGTLN